MFRKLMLAAVMAAAAAPALAAPQVTIKVDRMDPQAVHIAINHAAQQACSQALSNETTLVQFYTHADCIRATVADAETRYAAMRGLASR
jgi:hypothetical protein